MAGSPAGNSRHRVNSTMSAQSPRIHVNETIRPRARGAGSLSGKECAALLDEGAAGTGRSQVLQWLSGYLSAASDARNVVDVFPNFNEAEVLRLLRIVSLHNPEACLEKIVDRCVGALRPFYVRSDATVVRVSVEGKRADVYREFLRAVRSELKLAPVADNRAHIIDDFAVTALPDLIATVGVKGTGCPDALALIGLLRIRHNRLRDQQAENAELH